MNGAGQAGRYGDGFDMLVMGAYGHSRIRSLVIGSTGEMVRSRRCCCLDALNAAATGKTSPSGLTSAGDGLAYAA